MTYNIFDAAKDLVMGRIKRADKKVIEIRTQTCEPCDARNKTLNTCTVCGCFLPAKIRLKDASCPMELW